MDNKDSGQNEQSVENAAEQAASTSTRPRTIFVSLPSYSDREEAERGLKAQLEEDEIPGILRESGRLVAEGDSPDGDAVIGYLREILEKLSIARTGKPPHDLRIFLSDQQGINTGVITDAKTPILIVGLDLIDKLKEYGLNEDHLAPVLGHERFHLRSHEKWADLGDGRPEETVGDIWGIMEATDAGYSPNGLGQLFRRLFEEQKKNDNYMLRGGFGSVLGGLTDEHPKLEDRIRNTDIALASLQQKKRLSEKQTPIPDNIIAAAARTKYTSPWDQYKKDNGYETATPGEKVDIIAGYLDTELQQRDGEVSWMTNQPMPDMWLMSHRMADVYEDILSLTGQEGTAEAALKQVREFSKKQYGGEEIKDAYFWVLEKFVDLHAGKKSFRDSSFEDRGQFEFYNNHPMDFAENVPEDMRQLQTYSEAFWAATTKEEALTAANSFLEAQNELWEYWPGMNAMGVQPMQPAWPDRKRNTQADRLQRLCTAAMGETVSMDTSRRRR